ncbi:unnamed protein product [Jaminaea pallidilutea]
MVSRAGSASSSANSAATFGVKSHLTAAPIGTASTPDPEPQTGVAPQSSHKTSAKSSKTTMPPPHVIEGPSGRILCIADVRGNLRSLNALAAEHKAAAIIHTGDFGFYDSNSLTRIADKTLRHLVQYSSLIPQQQRTKLLSADTARGPSSSASGGIANLRAQISASPNPLLSEFPLLLDGSLKLDVPVFTVWGACEDVAILERLRTGEIRVPNLQILDEATSRAIEVGGVRLRLFGLGGAVVYHKLFDNGEGSATIAGGQGVMWTTILQIGELIDTAAKTFDETETRVLITHASPGKEGLLAQVALALKADLTVSAGLHFRYGLSYNEFAVQHDMENYRNKLLTAKAAFNDVWETVRPQVEEAIDDNQRQLLNNALVATSRVPPLATASGAASEEPAWKNCWHWNLPDASYGSLVWDIRDGRVSSEMKSQGFNFGFRRSKQQPLPAAASAATGSTPTPTAAQRTPATAAPVTPHASAAPHKATSHPAQVVKDGHVDGAQAAYAARGPPPAGPKTSNFAIKGTANAASPRSRQVAQAAAAPSSSDSDQTKPKFSRQGKNSQSHPASASTKEQGKQESKKNGSASTGNGDKPKDDKLKESTQQNLSGGAKDADTNAAAAAGDAGKSKRSRGGKSKSGGSKSGAESTGAGEASGVEGSASAPENGAVTSKKSAGPGGNKNKKKDEGKGDKDNKPQQQSSPSKPVPSEPTAGPRDTTKAVETPTPAADGNKPGEASGRESGKESGLESGGNKRGGNRGGGRGRGGGSGRGGGGGGRGRGGKNASAGQGQGQAAAASPST